MDSCCALGAEYDRRRQILHETDNFFVLPTLGPIGIEGYLLIVSKKHHIGIGGMPPQLYKELDEVTHAVRRVIRQEYGVEALVFEHGPRVCHYRGGGCLDHTHLHVVPGADIMNDLAVDLMTRLSLAKQFYRVDRIEGFDRLSDIFEEGVSSYLFVEAPNSTRLVTEVNFFIPSQYLRQMIAAQRDIRTWSWRLHPGWEVMERTADKLEGKF